METESAMRNGRTSDRSLLKIGDMFLVTNAPEQIVTVTPDWMFLRLCVIIWVCAVWTPAIGNSLTFAASRPVLGRSTAIRKKCNGTSHLSSAQRPIADARLKSASASRLTNHLSRIKMETKFQTSDCRFLIVPLSPRPESRPNVRSGCHPSFERCRSRPRRLAIRCPSNGCAR